MQIASGDFSAGQIASTIQVGDESRQSIRGDPRQSILARDNVNRVALVQTDRRPADWRVMPPSRIMRESVPAPCFIYN